MEPHSYPFLINTLGVRGYRVFPDELENDDHVFFHATARRRGAALYGVRDPRAGMLVRLQRHVVGAAVPGVAFRAAATCRATRTERRLSARPWRIPAQTRVCHRVPALVERGEVQEVSRFGLRDGTRLTSIVVPSFPFRWASRKNPRG